MFERSPDLKIGVTLPFFQIWEKVELTRDRLNIWVSDGAMTAAASFTTHFTDMCIPHFFLASERRSTVDVRRRPGYKIWRLFKFEYSEFNINQYK
jgi:hypothetical protein